MDFDAICIVFQTLLSEAHFVTNLFYSLLNENKKVLFVFFLIDLTFRSFFFN